jgi:hypothetical protein
MDFTKAVPANNGSGKPLSGIAAFDATEAAPEFSPVPPGTYIVRVRKGERTLTKAGDDAYRICFEIIEGEHKGQVLVRTWTFSPRALKYAKRDLARLGLTASSQLLATFPELGREYVCRLVVALHRSDDGIERNDIKRMDLLRVDETPLAGFLLPEEDEGGAK